VSGFVAGVPVGEPVDVIEGRGSPNGVPVEPLELEEDLFRPPTTPPTTAAMMIAIRTPAMMKRPFLVL
jgi:hypothetical protein